MALKLPPTRTAPPASPEDLFQTLRSRSPQIRNLWSHQADLLRSYQDAVGNSDLALELPTGAGKTLVALLIAEYRRQALGERVAYLCPTRQLAQQVGAQAKVYGIPAVVLVGGQRDYSPRDFGAYATAGAIAITTYNGIFNSNPKIENAQCLILDDAHAAENYIADFWSLTVDREKHANLYRAVLDIVTQDLPESLRHALHEENPTQDERTATGMVLQSQFWGKIGPLRDALTANVAGTDLRYPWSRLREHLEACNLFLNWNEFLLRPLAPPSETHAPFSAATQRVYLSATLGEGGELERVTGVRKIVRLPVPRGWERRAPGRRFIALPNLSLTDTDSASLAADVAMLVPRMLALFPDRIRLKKFEGVLAERGVKKVILGAGDIESSMEEFTSKDAVLLLTNRYDGLDLPDDSCRAMAIVGIPNATNLQERFLSQRLGAEAVLRDRVRTRVTQALGRCTRNDTDYAVVVLVGETLANTVSKAEFRAGMHPDLQVELAVGIENSKDTQAQDLLTTIESFLNDNTVRLEIENHVVGQRDQATKQKDAVATVLGTTVQEELAYVYAVWRGEWPRAYSSAKTVCDKLEGGRQIRPYQAFWYYLAASAASRIATANSDAAMAREANDLTERALASSIGISWFAKLKTTAQHTTPAPMDELDCVAAEAATTELVRLGHVGSRFERRMVELRRLLAERESKPFEQGLEMLGLYLGFQVFRPPTSARAAPDSVWNVGRALFFVFEAKSDENPHKAIPPSDVRQAVLHTKWVRDHYGLPPGIEVDPVLVTPQVSLDDAARPLADGLRIVPIDQIAALADDLASALRIVRTDVGASGENEIRARLFSEFRRADLLPSQVVARFTPLVSLPVADD